MLVSDLVRFRKDLLFQGAVQIGWFETDSALSEKAAGHFVFHGPGYHGIKKSDLDPSAQHGLVDTATFVLDLIQSLTGKTKRDDPFRLAIAGYGTGKSHLGVALAEVLSEPRGTLARKVVQNIELADPMVGRNVGSMLENLTSPYLVVAINGMQDFDLSREITRQVFLRLKAKGLSTDILEDLRPRFRFAHQFVDSFYDTLNEEFSKLCGPSTTKEALLARLHSQDEDVYKQVNQIFAQKMGTDIRATGQESLQEFLTTVHHAYCGPSKPFEGMIILFDEFGRYLEFAVEKPHIAGSGSLQQLFEGVQDNGDAVFLLSFIQYELKAYMTRVAPEQRDSLNRYVSRFDAVPKVRLSTNLETLLASLLEKVGGKRLTDYIKEGCTDTDRAIMLSKLRRWFPDLSFHSLWDDPERFRRIVVEGCWPLHPSATWFLYRLSSAGKALQQRSALSFLAQVLERYESFELPRTFWTIPATALCTDDMVNEFLASERYGQQGAIAHAFENVKNKYGHELTVQELDTLRAILLASKIGLRAETREECNEALSTLSGRTTRVVEQSLKKLLAEYNVVEWNDLSHQYEIVGDALPRRAFTDFLQARLREITLDQRSQYFATKAKQWLSMEDFQTDFGTSNQITTSEWAYTITFSNVALLRAHISYALRAWQSAFDTDSNRGQLIYCYIGPESDLATIHAKAGEWIEMGKKELGLSHDEAVPIAVMLLSDTNSELGNKLAEYYVLTEGMQEDEGKKFANFIMERKDSAQRELEEAFRRLERARNLVFAIPQQIPGERLRGILTGLFSVVYPACAPFPFDGFHTKGGNAAKDCQLFTTELFIGNLNQTWISTRKTQQKNRAISVLYEGWQALGPDGEVKLRPTNSRVAALLDHIDSLLKIETIINLGYIVRQMCAPPYGCNIASAGMLLGVYLSPRREKIWFMKDEEVVSVENWISNAFQGNFLGFSALDKTFWKLADVAAADEWDALLNEWFDETSFEILLSLLSKAGELKKRVPLPAAYGQRYTMLCERSQEAASKLRNWMKIMEDETGFYEKAYEKRNAGNLSRCGAELVKLKNRMETEHSAWSKRHFEEIEEQILRARTATQHFFPAWLRGEVVIDAKAWGDFETRMKRIEDNLKRLSLLDEQRDLSNHVDNVRSQVDRRQRLGVIVDQIDLFVYSHKVSPITRVKELSTLVSEAKNLEKPVLDARASDNVPQLDTAYRKLQRFITECEQQLRSHKERAQKIWNATLSSLSQVEQALVEVRSLIGLFEGQEDDLSDFNLMLRFLNNCLRDFGDLSSQALSEADLLRQLENCLSAAKECSGEDGDLPWDVDEVYKELVREVFEGRARKANAWMTANVPRDSEIATMDAINLNRLRNRLLGPPIFAGNEELLRIAEKLSICNARLDALEVEGLLERFKSLSPQARFRFLELVQKMVSVGSEEIPSTEEESIDLIVS